MIVLKTEMTNDDKRTVNCIDEANDYLLNLIVIFERNLINRRAVKKLWP